MYMSFFRANIEHERELDARQGVRCIYIHTLRAFLFPVMIMIMMIIVQRVQREAVNYTHEEAEKVYFLSYLLSSFSVD